MPGVNPGTERNVTRNRMRQSPWTNELARQTAGVRDIDIDLIMWNEKKTRALLVVEITSNPRDFNFARFSMSRIVARALGAACISILEKDDQIVAAMGYAPDESHFIPVLRKYKLYRQGDQPFTDRKWLNFREAIRDRDQEVHG